MRTTVVRVLALLGFAILGFSAPASAQCAAYGANPNDWTPDDQQLRQCFDNNAYVYLERGNPGYVINEGLVLHSITRLVTSTGDKAILIAGADLVAPMLQTSDTSGYELSELIFDGRKGFRFRTDVCGGDNRFGLNLDLSGDDYHVHHVDVLNAMCRSGAFARGGNFEINSVFFGGNGFPQNEVDHQYANGMHVTRCTGGYIHNNWFVDNTDVGLAIVSGYNCQVLWNEITNYNAEAFAGLHVGDTTDNQDLSGAVVAYNTINSGYNKLPFGLVVGPHPWNAGFTYANVGEVRNNTIAGAVVNLAIDGIDSGYISDNVTSGHQGDRAFNCPGFSAEATAIHFGSATINQTYIPKHYHGGGCGS